MAINIHGTRKDVEVLIDTGFTRGSGYGLKVPLDYARHAKSTVTGSIQVGDGRDVDFDYIPDAKVIEVEGHVLAEEVTIPAIFMDGPKVVGNMFLQRCVLRIDGPQKEVIFEF